MKRSYIKNRQAQVSEGEGSMVEDVAGPITFDMSKILLILFIILPVIYVLVVQTPGSWLPKELPKSPVVPEVQKAPDVNQGNQFATLDSAIIKASNDPSFDNYFQLSFEFYKAKKFKESITAAEKALEMNPRSAPAYNNICSAYNELNEFTKAREACKKALELDPAFQLAKNNLSWAEKQIAAGNK